MIIMLYIIAAILMGMAYVILVATFGNRIHTTHFAISEDAKGRKKLIFIKVKNL